MTSVFEREIERGTGVPYLLLKKGCIRPSEQIDEILYANIVENKAYDPQSEGSRAEYIYNLLEFYPRREKIDERIIAYFCAMTDTDWGERQVFEFVRKLAQAGRFDKSELYKKFEYYAEEDMYNGMIGIADLLLIDTYKAVVYLARYFGMHITDGNSQEFVGQTFYAPYEEELGYAEATLSEMLHNEHDAAIDRYLSIARRMKRNKPSAPPKNLTTEEVIAVLEKTDTSNISEFVKLRMWTQKYASDADIQNLSNAFMEVGTAMKRKLIRLFRSRPIRVPARILFGSFDEIDDSSYRRNLCEALVPLNEPAIYDFLKKQYNETTKTCFIRACLKYYSEDKKAELLEALEECTIHDIHEILDDALESEALMKYPFYNDILRMLYQKMKCSVCREKIIKQMMLHHSFDDNLYEEIQYDANQCIRRMARKR